MRNFHRWSAPSRIQTTKKNCAGCHRKSVRNPNDLVCSFCWSGLPQPLKTAFTGGHDAMAKRLAARAIFDHLGSSAARSAVPSEEP